MTSRGVASGLALLSLLALLGAGPRPAAPDEPGLHVVSVTVLGPDELPGTAGRVRHAAAPIFRLDAVGRPDVSSAGFVALEPEGSGFLSAWRLDERRAGPDAERTGRAVSWGDPEAFAGATFVIRRWRAAHPDGPRLVIGDISAEWGGFPDLDGNGAADHLTHQLGLNVNVLLPCRSTPEREVALEAPSADAFDREGLAALARLAIEAGATGLTTNVATGLADAFRDAGSAPEVDDERMVGRRITPWTGLMLMKAPGDHGNHVNVLFGCKF